MNRNGYDGNVAAVLAHYENADPRFMNLDRNDFMIFAGGEMLDFRVSDVTHLPTEEYAALRQLAGGRHIWFEDVSTFFLLDNLCT